MKRELLVFLSVITLAVAMVPRLRRTVKMDQEKILSDTTTSQTLIICEPQTPCAWSIYKDAASKVVETVIVNTYCQCKIGTKCVSEEDESPSTNAYTHRCKPPSAEGTAIAAQ